MNITKHNTVNCSSRENYKPLFIVWHIAEGTYNGTISWEKNPASETSSHYVLGKDGKISQLVDLTKAAWTQGKIAKPTHPYVKAHPGVNPNLYCISIECEGFWKDTKGKLTDKQLAAAVELTKHIVNEVKRIYGITIPIDREHIIGHCEINSASRSHCPGELFPFNELINKVKNSSTPTQPVSKSFYTIQIGSFGNTDSANKLYKKVSDMGYFSFINKSDNMNKVCIGKFPTRKDAQRTLNDLKKKGIHNGFITTSSM